MKGVVKTGYTLNIRDASNIVIGKLNGGDAVYGDVANNRIAYSKVYRANGTVDTIAGSSAVGEGSTVWIVITSGAEPTPNPAPVPGLPVLNVEVSAEGYTTVDIELRPK